MDKLKCYPFTKTQNTILPKKLYPINVNELILTKDVQIRDTPRVAQQSCAPDTIDIISSSACKMPYNFMGTKMSVEYTGIMYRKILYLFLVALEYQYDVLILGAWGCGGYRCPPEHVSALFKMVLEEFKGCFKKVIFAIRDTENHPKSNLNIFKQQFK